MNNELSNVKKLAKLKAGLYLARKGHTEYFNEMIKSGFKIFPLKKIIINEYFKWHITNTMEY